MNVDHPLGTSPAPSAPHALSMRAPRAIAPDMARGAMLLLIAIANGPWYLWAATKRGLGSHAPADTGIDAVLQTVSLVAIDGRTYPMFAFLFGYGIWQFYRRQLDAGVSKRDARRVLRRRHWWMIAFGAAHAALLWMGDIIGAYGIAGLLLTWLFLDRKDATIRVWAIVVASLLVAMTALTTAGGAIALALGTDPALFAAPSLYEGGITQTNYLQSILPRIEIWAVLTPSQAILGGSVPLAILLAFLAARHRVLEEPERHLRLLRAVAIGGIAIGWTTGGVVAAQNLNLWGASSDLDWMFMGAQTLSGVLCGIGYVAVFGLIAAWMSRRARHGRVSYALQAVGKRSLTSYLAQSVIMAPLLAAWGFGLGATFSMWSVTLLAIATWLVSLFFAVALERRGLPGPAEQLLRRLSYGRPQSQAVKSP